MVLFSHFVDPPLPLLTSEWTTWDIAPGIKFAPIGCRALLVSDGSYTNGTRTVLGNFDNGLKGDQCSQFAAMQDIFWMQSANVVQEGIVKCTWKNWKTRFFAFVPSAFCANSTQTSLTTPLCSEVNVINAKNCVLLQRCTFAVSKQSTSFPAATLK